jgi:hypothetical protein
MTDNEPVMDGANDDMSDGTPRNEAADQRDGDVEAPHSLAEAGGLEDDPLGNSGDDGSLSSQNL